jgi:hypothetical protein
MQRRDAPGIRALLPHWCCRSGEQVDGGAQHGLRETTRLVAVEPDFSDIEAPVKMLNPQIAGRAVHLGTRQAEREAATIQAAWGV